MNDWDVALFLALNAGPDAPPMTLAIARWVSSDMPTLAAVASLLLVSRYPHARRRLAAVVTAMALAWLATRAIRWAIPMERPFVTGLGFQGMAHAASASFPSLHAAVASAWAAALALHRGEQPAWLGGVACLVAAGIAWSRLYLGRHYPTDIAAGLLLGWGCAVLTHGLIRREPWARRRWWRLRTARGAAVRSRGRS